MEFEKPHKPEEVVGAVEVDCDRDTLDFVFQSLGSCETDPRDCFGGFQVQPWTEDGERLLEHGFAGEGGADVGVVD